MNYSCNMCPMPFWEETDKSIQNKLIDPFMVIKVCHLLFPAARKSLFFPFPVSAKKGEQAASRLGTLTYSQEFRGLARYQREVNLPPSNPTTQLQTPSLLSWLGYREQIGLCSYSWDVGVGEPLPTS